ncbi:MAG: alanyl-tRNA editing protein [Lachnospiraceae bacterium]|nr:alanyl-tRNA editing protein [Lachnospiraceae bacterium]
MTKALYDIEPYNTDFDAIILESVKVDDDKYEIVLDQTQFFPEQGGQTPDVGIMEVQEGKTQLSIRKCQQFEVVDVQIRKDEIYHTICPIFEDENAAGELSEEEKKNRDAKIERLLSPGNNVNGFVDWNHRFSNMQQHTGEHIFSGLVHGTFGYDNVGFHLSDSVVTMDFNGVITPEQIRDIETRANEVIYENKEVEISYLKTDEEKESLDYRSKIEIEGDVRIVTIPGVDVCACCAPHVKRTGEIGLLKVMSIQNYKGGVRVSILCGKRGLEAFRQADKVVSDLVNELNSPAEELLGNVLRIQQNVYDLKQSLGKYMYDDLMKQAGDIPESEANAIIFTGEVDNKAMRECVNAMVKKHDGICGVFAENDKGYNFIIGSKTINCTEIAALLREKCNAKGGGKSEMIQGSVQATKKDLMGLLQD